MTKTIYDNYVTYHIDMVYAENETKLLDKSNQVQSMTKTRQDNYVTNSIDAIYAEIKIELL